MEKLVCAPVSQSGISLTVDMMKCLSVGACRREDDPPCVGQTTIQWLVGWWVLAKSSVWLWSPAAR